MPGANEATLQLDNSCVAAANYYDPAVPLLGPQGSGQFLAVFISAARTVSLLLSQTVSTGYGFLQNTPGLGMAANVAIGGITKAVAGAAINGGQEVMVNGTGVNGDGRVIPWTAGGTRVKLGIALTSASAANKVFTMRIYPSPAKLLT